MTSLRSFINQSYPDLAIQMPGEALDLMADTAAHPCVSIKQKEKGYLYANANYHYLCGLYTPNSILYKKDEDLTLNRKLALLYQDHDAYAIEYEKAHYAEAPVEPNKCGVSRKSALIDLFMSNRLLQQIVV